MELRQLKYFLAIAKEGQVTRAAQNLNMAQPPLSMQLKALEEELGVVLFERTRKHMQLTQAGELLSIRAESIFHQLSETVTELKELHNGITGTLMIGSALSCSPLLPPRIQSFRAAYPKVKFRIWEGDPNGLTLRIAKREIDIGIIRLPLETEYDSNQFEIIKIKEESFVAILPPEWDPDRTNSDIQLADLQKMPFILLRSENATGTQDIIKEACRRIGFEPNVVCECSNISTILSIIKEGIGVTVLHKAIASSIHFPLSIKNLTGTSIRSEIALVYLKHRLLPRSVQLFINTFKE
ncbi:LysR family transcriptional regulator [Paenibacillus sp. FSL K6-0276]|uniref:LysR family transcriptional regulator n=1 Tax=Paenibacillus sp. FSL K6-0276 TaxID=2921450 RepID=UPI0030EEA3D2